MALSISMQVLLLTVVSCCVRGCAAGLPVSATNTFTPFQYSKFQKNFFVAWSESNVAAVDGGHTLQLSLNRKSGELEKVADSFPLSSIFIFVFYFLILFCHRFSVNWDTQRLKFGADYSIINVVRDLSVFIYSRFYSLSISVYISPLSLAAETEPVLCR